MGIVWGIIGTAVAIAAALTWYAVSKIGQARALEGGSLVEAQVIDHHMRNSEDGTSWFLTYTFKPEGSDVAIEGDALVDTLIAERAVESKTVAVRYLPDAPKTHRIDGNVSPTIWPVIWAAVAWFAAIAVAVALLRSE